MSSDKDKSKLNYKAIASGWKNYIFKSPHIEALAKERAKICADNCQYFSAKHKFKGKLMPDNTLKEIEGVACTSCGCPLSSKLRQVLEQCPEKKW